MLGASLFCFSKWYLNFVQFGLLLSLALRFGFFMLVASYSIDSDTNREVLSELHNFNDLVGIVVLTVMLVFVAVVVDRLVKYRCALWGTNRLCNESAAFSFWTIFLYLMNCPDTSRIRLHCLRQWWENLARTIRCVVISILLVVRLWHMHNRLCGCEVRVYSSAHLHCTDIRGWRRGSDLR